MSASNRRVPAMAIMVGMLLLISPAETGAECTDFWTRRHLTGDMWGLRPSCAEQGIVYDLELTQFYQGIANGGARQEFFYGGKMDYNFTLLGDKLGINEGFRAMMHAETRFGRSIGPEAGPFALPNANMIFPLPGEHDTAITGLLLMQALSERVALAAGKINVLDFWTMIYPHAGRGLDGFMNVNSFSVGLPWLRFVSPAALGAGVLTMKEKDIQGGVLVFDTNNSTTTSGFSNLFDQGAGVLGLWKIYTNCPGKPGSHAFIGGWSSRTYTSLDRTEWLVLPSEGLVAGEETGAWALAYYFDQIVWADPCDAGRNLRLFTGYSLSDGNPSFARWGGLVSVQGTGLIARRRQDRMGVAYFYNDPSNELRKTIRPVADLKELQGVELYYNAEITPYFHLTADLQILDNAIQDEKTAILVGLRGKIDL